MSAEEKNKSNSAKKKKTIKKTQSILSGDLTLQTAGAVKDLFAKVIKAKGDATFRFENVGDVDLSFIQIVCSAHRLAHDNGKCINFEGEWPEAFAQLLEESGLNVHVGCSLDGGVECPWISNKTS